MEMEAHHVEDEEEVLGLLRRPKGGPPRKGEGEGGVAATAVGDDVEVNESPPGRNGLLVDVEKEEEEEEKGWVGAVVNEVGEGGGRSSKRGEDGGEVVVAMEDDEVIMQGATEETDSWDISGVRGFSEDETEQEEGETSQQTDLFAVEECTLDRVETHEPLDKQPGHGTLVDSIKDHLGIEDGSEVEVISGVLYSNVEGITNHEYSNGVFGIGEEGLILEEADKEEILEEDNIEETEYDVENVLEKQNTHDLFCPNCKSCITMRVILCRKRRKVRNLRYRIKVERAPVAASNAEQVVTEEDSNVSAIVTDINEDPISTANEETANRDLEVDEDREVFKCLTCLSFFIRTRDGSKPFWNFGGKKLGADVQDLPQEVPPTKTNTFFSFFMKRKVAAGQDKAEAEETQTETREIREPLITNQAMAHQNDVPLSTNGISAVTNTSVHIGLSIDSSKDAVNYSRDSDKMAEPLQSGVSLAMNGDSLGKDMTEVPREIQKGDNLMEDAVKDSPIIYQENSQLSETIMDKTTIKIEQTIEGKVQKREPSKVIQPSAAASWVLGQTHIEIDVETAKHIPAMKGLSTLPDKVTPVPQASLSEASTAIVNSSMASGKQLIKDIEDLSLQSAVILQDAVKRTMDDVIISMESTPAEEAAPQTDAVASLAAPQLSETGRYSELDIVKSIVFGGLIESITSLGVVSSAAGGGASTLNTLALALANIFGGLFVIAHRLRELKNEQPSTTATGETQDRYTELLGNRRHILLHATVVILSFIVFGAVAPVTYAFSFRKSDSRDYKLAAVAGASLFCILLLATGKAYLRRPPEPYLKTISYYLTMGVVASGISFLVGELFDYLLQKLGWFKSTSSLSDPLLITIPTGYGSAFY